MAFEPKSYTYFLQRMANRIVARSGLTDTVVGGGVHSVISSVARELDDMSFQAIQLQDVWDIDTATGDDLDLRGGDIPDGKLSRRAAAKATGSVVFSRTGSSGAVTIPVGTVVRVPGGGPEFQTTASGSIADGDTVSASVNIVALEAGTDSNVEVAAITQMDAVSGVETVTNGAVTSGGQGEESDAEFRNRIKLYIRALPRGTPLALEYAALGASIDADGDGEADQRVVSAQALQFPTGVRGITYLYIDDGTGTVATSEDTYASPENTITNAGGGEVRFNLANSPIVEGTVLTLKVNGVAITENTDFTIDRSTSQVVLDSTVYPTGLTAGDDVTAEYTYHTGLIAEVQKIVNGDSADRTNYPGYKAAGTMVWVKSPTVYQLIITGTVVVLANRLADRDDIVAKVKSEIIRYVNGLGIGQDVIYTSLIAAAKSVDGVYDITFTAPTGNYAIGDGELARATAANVTIL
jgi:uncharacterized phage protein gp47/JayE